VSREFDIKELDKKFSDARAEEIIAWAVSEIGVEKFVLASSMSVEGQVLTDMLISESRRGRVITIDSGRLNQETYDVIAYTRERYGIDVEIVFPDSRELVEMVEKNGINLFYDGVEKRKLCCEIRKVRPLKKKLEGLDAWICGLRREDSDSRSGIKKFEWDGNFGLLKINPIADWTEAMLWEYAEKRKIRTNELYRKGYKSIGCAPCTRAVEAGAHPRSGRWWWEPSCHSECGLHVVDGKLKGKN